MPTKSVYGLKLNYTQTGPKTGPVLLMIHGWCSDHTSFEEQLDHFSKTHNCYAVDLPGFGKSARTNIDHTITFLAEVMIGFIKEMKLKKVSLIGHSMGGLIALEMLYQNTDIADISILIDPAPIIHREKIIAIMQQTLASMEGKGFDTAVKEWADTYMIAFNDTPALRKWLLANAKKVSPHVARSSWKSMLSWNGKFALKAAQEKPLAVISAAKSQNDPRKLRDLAPKMMWGQVLNGSHHCHISDKAQVNAMIEAALNSK